MDDNIEKNNQKDTEDKNGEQVDDMSTMTVKKEPIIVSKITVASNAKVLEAMEKFEKAYPNMMKALAK